MTIAVNTRFLIKGRLEGIGWFTYEVVKRLVEKHPDWQFIFFFDRPFEDEFIFAPNIHPVVLFPPARHPFLFYLWFEWAVTRALKKYKADLFFSTDGFLSLKTKVPTLLVIHDLAHIHFPNQVKFSEQLYYNYFMPRFAKKAKRIATVSEYSRQDIHRQYQISPEKIDVVYNGVRSRFQPLTPEKQQQVREKYTEGQSYFFYIGAVHPRKNVPQLIRSFELFKQTNSSRVQLVIAGRLAWQTRAVKAELEKARHQQDIHFLDYLPDDQVSDLMGSALALVYISLFEGFGIPLLEAMYCQVPIIYSNVSSLPEVAGKAGIPVVPTSTQSISDAMTRLYSQPELRDQLIREGIKQKQKFSWQKTADKIEDSLKKIVRTIGQSPVKDQ